MSAQQAPLAALVALAKVTATQAVAAALSDSFGHSQLSSQLSQHDASHLQSGQPSQQSFEQHSLLEQSLLLHSPLEHSPSEHSPLEHSPFEQVLALTSVAATLVAANVSSALFGHSQPS